MQYLKLLESKGKTEFYPHTKNFGVGIYLVLTLMILSWIIPDALPFIDEIVLGYLAVVKFRQLSSS